MWAEATSRFKVGGGKMVRGIDLVTDGAVSHAVGEVDTALARADLRGARASRMKELFWACKDRFTLTGTGEFAGTTTCSRAGASCRAASPASERA